MSLTSHSIQTPEELSSQLQDALAKIRDLEQSNAKLQAQSARLAKAVPDDCDQQTADAAIAASETVISRLEEEKAKIEKEIQARGPGNFLLMEFNRINQALKLEQQRLQAFAPPPPAAAIDTITSAQKQQLQHLEAQEQQAKARYQQAPSDHNLLIMARAIDARKSFAKKIFKKSAA